MVPAARTQSSDVEAPPPPQSFEIKVALIGKVSSDNKTALLNSLLHDKFGEVSSVTSNTTSVNEFALVSSRNQWELVTEDDPERNILTLKSVVGPDHQEVITKRFEAETEVPPFEMLKNTKLVLVDIPSFHGEVDTKKNKYMDYAEHNWSSFDCIVVVMDARQGPKEQEPLLQFVKDNLYSKKDLPVVVLFNKVDDDSHHNEQVELARSNVEKMFGVTDRQENLDVILDTYDMLQHSDEDLQVTHFGEDKHKPSWAKISPVFIPQTGFEDSNVDTLLKVLSFVIGGEDNQKRIIEERTQLLLSNITCEPGFVQQLEVLHKSLVSLSSENVDVQTAFWQLCTALEQSYFDCPELLKATEAFASIANECREYHRFATEQGWETEATRVVAAARSSCCRFFASMQWHFGFVFDLKLMHNKLKEVSPSDAIDPGTKKALNDTFHRLIADLWRQTLVAVKVSDALKFLSALVDEIIEYDKMVKEAGLKFVRSYIEDTFGFFLRHHLQTLCQKASDGLLYYSYMDPNIPQNSFASLTPIDWNRVFRSILLLRYDPRFCQEFGNEIVWMEYLIDQSNSSIVPDLTGNARLKPSAHNQRQLFMKPIQKVNQLLPSNGFNLSQTVLEIPASFADPKHFAHVAWRYCEFMEGRYV